MSEYRYNLIMNRWVIIASERGKRPIDFASSARNQLSKHDSKCPFCPGNEGMTPPETYAIRPDDSNCDQPGWYVRVVPNKYPAVGLHKSSTSFCPENDNLSSGTGVHEVIIESSRHDQSLAHYSSSQALMVFQSLRQRYQQHAQLDWIRLISIFNNHGPSSGASLNHPHFQFIGLSMVPPRLTAQLEHCQRYYSTYHTDVFQKTIEQETASKERVIARNEHFIALCPIASMTPFEVYLLPTQPVSRFEDSSNDMLRDLTRLLQPILSRLYEGLGDPDYNLVLHTAPIGDERLDYFRWFVQLYPRMHPSGGFEIGTDIYINTMPPESAAQFYRSQ